MRLVCGGTNLVLQVIFVHQARLGHWWLLVSILYKETTEQLLISVQAATFVQLARLDLTKQHAQLEVISIQQAQAQHAVLAQQEVTATKECN